jgi:hypothetical protein
MDPTNTQLTRPITPTEFDIFDQVFINSSPPNTTILQNANRLLCTTINTCATIKSPVHRYIQKLATGTEKFQAQNIIHQYDINNMRSIMKKHMTCMKGKRIVLKGHFHVSIQELYDAVKAAEMYM